MIKTIKTRVAFRSTSVLASVLSAASAFLLVGCASQSRPLNLSTSGTQASAAATDEPRVQCKCGTWAGTKGAPTQCKKVLLQREHEREAAAAAAAAAQARQATTPATQPSAS